MTNPAQPTTTDTRLYRLLWLSIAAAVATISLKTVAWLLTGSVGLLSDAAESVVNLVAAVVALAVLRRAAKPADEEHAYGHAKAEYFSAGIEGALIFLAAVTIAWTAIDRLLHPQALEDVGIGITVSVVASLINLGVGLLLVRTGREHRSITLEADGRHLLTDVWTSAGVVIGVAAVAITDWERLDALVALAVAINIIFTGTTLVRRSAAGLMDRALRPEQLAEVQAALSGFEDRGVQFHALRTREAGQRAFVSVHVLVPGTWSVQRRSKTCVVRRHQARPGGGHRRVAPAYLVSASSSWSARRRSRPTVAGSARWRTSAPMCVRTASTWSTSPA